MFRFLNRFRFAGMTSMVVVYVSEIAHSSHRQVLLSLNSVFFSVGVLFATTVGSLFQWQAVNVIFFIFTAVTTLLLVIFLPESPVWLAKFRTNRNHDTRNSMRRIYPKNDQVRMTIFTELPKSDLQIQRIPILQISYNFKEKC